jgi:hypothetical protein
VEEVRSVKVAFILACLLVLEGCAAAALSIAGMAGGAGLDHTLNGIVARTYAAPVAGTRLAALQTLRRMGMTVEKSEKQDKGWVIEAKAADRTIDIELEALTNRTTRARVVVSKKTFVFIKDSSTSNEIIDQMSIELSRFTFKRLRLATAQMLLGELGYDPGEADGLMGKKTRNAILRFQRKNQIRVDGRVSSRLITRLQKRQSARDAAALRAKKGKYAAQDESATR